jgi:hypothetical protein
MSQKEIRNFVTKFIENNSTNTDLVDAWNSKDTQKQFNKLFNQKVKKDKNAPKKGLNAYNIFCNEERVKIKAENPDIDSKSIFKELAVRWNTAKLDESLMERYQQMVLKDKERYNSELESYVPTENTKKAKSTERKAKMPKNAYMFFCEDEREKVKKEKPELKSKDILVELGERWRKIKGTKSSTKYEDKAANDKKRYEIEKTGLASIPEEVVEKEETPVVLEEEEEEVVVKPKAEKKKAATKKTGGKAFKK